MRLTAAALLPLALVLAYSAPVPAAAAPARASAHAPAPTVIRDPRAFVAGVYARLTRGVDFSPPEDIYSPRLAALWAGMEHDAGGEVGRVDFMFWVNAQDGEISDVAVTQVPVEGRPLKDRVIVVARFKNMGQVEELHFYFERTKAGWKLDDVESVTPDNTWTLSVLLKYGWYREEKS
jgi:hypothetical protein